MNTLFLIKYFIIFLIIDFLTSISLNNSSKMQNTEDIAKLPFVMSGFRYGAPLEKTMAAMVAAAQEKRKMYVCSELSLGGHTPASNSYSTNLGSRDH